VDQVSNHVEPLAVDVLLAWMVEVKLFEGINLVANCQSAAWRVIDHDGVAIVDDTERDRIVIELELGKIRKFGVGNVGRKTECCGSGENHTLDKEQKKKVKESKRKMSKVGFCPHPGASTAGAWDAVRTNQFCNVSQSSGDKVNDLYAA